MALLNLKHLAMILKYAAYLATFILSNVGMDISNIISNLVSIRLVGWDTRLDIIVEDNGCIAYLTSISCLLLFKVSQGIV